MTFTKEAAFEEALIQLLTQKGWESKILKRYTEKQLIQNWADILFENNREKRRLNGCPLTEGEMQQVMEQVTGLRSPFALNGFINGGFVTIKRDNEEDALHFGKEVSLKIYDRREIAGGQSRYQIAEQPIFHTPSALGSDRRGDVMLLINGMPVFHIELKKSGVPVSQACYQIEKYAAEGVYHGIFSMVQIFVAMNPEETVYFANPGQDGRFNKDYYFHWADFNNEPVNDWQRVTSLFLSIPMAHQMIGFYTVADAGDGILKVMRSYQYYAASAISDRVARNDWESGQQRGGYVWHTTGSGKTMTSFKAAQLISESGDADKVVFLLDRIELGTQSVKAYRNFDNAGLAVQATENTAELMGKLKSSNPNDKLIVTSIQKMSNIKEDAGLNTADLQKMARNRIVFIVDECHRSSFGDMMHTVKMTFPKALFFGFTGTPIQAENEKKGCTTGTVFGDELHRYSIADGIRDKNVLGFDPYKILIYRDEDVRKEVALRKAGADTEAEVFGDPQKEKIYYDWLHRPMAGHTRPDGSYEKGVEDELPDSQYNCAKHRRAVVKQILDGWNTVSRNRKFHGMLATSSIQEAVEYYRLFKHEMDRRYGAGSEERLKVTALFDPSIDNVEGAFHKEWALREIVEDYDDQYDQHFTIPSFGAMKKDIASRLAHKDGYQRIDKKPEEQLDLLIVVDQMLTGFDSKWVNVLYLDKMLQYENIIQAFSRTNRLFGADKPFGIIKYYRRPHTMEKNIEAAVKLYSGDQPLGLFVDKLKTNLEKINQLYSEIQTLFMQAGHPDFQKVPESDVEKRKFAALMRELSQTVEGSKVQGFRWDQSHYEGEQENAGVLYQGLLEAEGADIPYVVDVILKKEKYLTLVQRYKELFDKKEDTEGRSEEELPYDIDPNIMSIDTEDIDTDYMNSRFTKYLKLLHQGDEAALKTAADALHQSFAGLSQEDQKFAGIFLRDIQRGDVVPEEGKTFRDYIAEYKMKSKHDLIHQLAEHLGVDEERLRTLTLMGLNENTLDQYGQYEALRKTIDRGRAKVYIEAVEGKKLIPPMVMVEADKLLRQFILAGGTALKSPDTYDESKEN